MTNFKKYENVLLSKRFSIDEKQLFLIGSIAEFILSREYFKSNSAIRDYAQYYFDKADEPLRDYLLDSRTLLVARISKIVLSEKGFDEIINFINYHMEYLNEQVITINSNKKNSNNNSILDVLLKGMDMKDASE
jgi:hypothetical protein